jgi:hypothetical protein
MRKYEPNAHRVLWLQQAIMQEGESAMLDAQPYNGPFAESALSAFVESMSGKSDFETTVDPEVPVPCQRQCAFHTKSQQGNHGLNCCGFCVKEQIIQTTSREQTNLYFGNDSEASDHWH